MSHPTCTVHRLPAGNLPNQSDASSLLLLVVEGSVYKEHIERRLLDWTVVLKHFALMLSTESLMLGNLGKSCFEHCLTHGPPLLSHPTTL